MAAKHPGRDGLKRGNLCLRHGVAYKAIFGVWASSVGMAMQVVYSGLLCSMVINVDTVDTGEQDEELSAWPDRCRGADAENGPGPTFSGHC